MPEHTLSDMQKKELAILKEFLSICEKNNLRYFICGGSFLGTVRHKGFIPWDDDIDVAMPRADYEQFLEIAPGLLSETLYLSTYKLGKKHMTLGAMITDKNKNFTLNNATKQVAIGAWLDILVIDGAPDPGVKRALFGIRYMFSRMLYQFAHFDEIVNMNKKRPWYENVAIRFAQITKIERLLNPVKVGDHLHKVLKTYPYETSKYVATFVGCAKMKEIVPKEVYGVGTEYEFEDILVKGPDLADEFLTHFYGDYMTPPPLDQRNRHNLQEGT